MCGGRIVRCTMGREAAVSETNPLTLLIVTGSVRRDRAGEGLYAYLANAVEAAGHRALVADPLTHQLPLLDRMYKEFPAGEAPETMETLAGMIRSADGVMVVSPEYNHGIPAALKNLLDHFLEEWFHKPCGIACYSAGRFGGVRAAMQLRMTLAELGMPTIPTLLPVPSVQTAVGGDGTQPAEWLTKATNAFIAELAWWSEAARRQKALAPPVSS